MRNVSIELCFVFSWHCNITTNETATNSFIHILKNSARLHRKSCCQQGALRDERSVHHKLTNQRRDACRSVVRIRRSAVCDLDQMQKVTIDWPVGGAATPIDLTTTSLDVTAPQTQHWRSDVRTSQPQKYFPSKKKNPEMNKLERHFTAVQWLKQIRGQKKERKKTKTT